MRRDHPNHRLRGDDATAARHLAAPDRPGVPVIRSGNRTMAAPVFIVSTGRCGSTMLSDIVNLHPRMLSLSEFLAWMGEKVLVGGSMGGKALLRRFSSVSSGARYLLRNDLVGSNYLYRFGPGSRFGPDDVPPIMGITLPHLSEDPEALWDELVPAVRARKRDTLAGHYRWFFEWLAHRFERDIWIERSGTSLLLVPALARLFPDARFVHIYRDGRDTAMSMQRHITFRVLATGCGLMWKLGLDPFKPANWFGTSRWRPWFIRLTSILFSPKRFQARELPLPVYGWMWSNMIERGTAYLAELPEDQVLPMRYESVLESPRDELSRFIDFVGPEFADADWLDRASELPRNRPPSWLRLTPEEHESLAKACAPGQRILGYGEPDRD